MAMAAGRDCLAGSHAQPDLSGVYLASNTLPFADRLNAGVIAAALGLNEAIEAADITGSRRAGLTAIRCAASRCPIEGGRILVAASDLRQARPASASAMAFGDGAAESGGAHA